MATKKLLTNGNAFKRTDGRWGGTVWFMDESGERKRKSFSGTTKQEVNKKMTAYIEDFNREIENSIEANKTLKESMTNWLQVFKFPSVERTTYDRYECTVINQIYPLIGDKTVGNISSADIKKVLNVGGHFLVYLLFGRTRKALAFSLARFIHKTDRTAPPTVSPLERISIC